MWWNGNEFDIRFSWSLCPYCAFMCLSHPFRSFQTLSRWTTTPISGPLVRPGRPLAVDDSGQRPQVADRYLVHLFEGFWKRRSWVHVSTFVAFPNTSIEHDASTNRLGAQTNMRSSSMTGKEMDGFLPALERYVLQHVTYFAVNFKAEMTSLGLGKPREPHPRRHSKYHHLVVVPVLLDCAREDQFQPNFLTPVPTPYE